METATQKRFQELSEKSRKLSDIILFFDLEYDMNSATNIEEYERLVAEQKEIDQELYQIKKEIYAECNLTF